MNRDRAATAFHEFLVETKNWWMSDLYATLKTDYRERTADAAPSDSATVARVMASSATYQGFAWLERHIQRAKYSGRWGLERLHADERPQLDEAARAKLRLDPKVKITDYYAYVDTHQHPGNLHGAANAGIIYKASAQSTQPGATRGYALHERFANVVSAYGDFHRILDMGCGFGKSALLLAERFRDATVTGVDMSAPCLELAAQEAVAANAANLAYEQADMVATPYADGSFDLATSTMVLHEMDMPAVRRTFAECYRLLEPGGTTVHLDFRVKDPFLEFLHYGHSYRNNEPFMLPLNELDVEAELRAAGFTDVQTRPFAEAEGATAPDWPRWRLPWTMFVGRKPARPQG